MSGFTEDSDRQLIPRWRFMRDFGDAPEIHGDPRHSRSRWINLQHLDERLEVWRAAPTIATAADAVACGITYDKSAAVVDPAKYLLENSDRTLPQVVRMARAALHLPIAKRHIDDGQLPLESPSDTQAQAISVIRERRLQLRRNPKNALAAIDMARGYAILGQSQKALDSIRHSLIVAPHHRLTLRTGSRFFIHSGDPEQAHYLLSKSPRTKQDPWLMATEIAIAPAANRTSQNIKRARMLVESKTLPDEQLTELHSALATQFLEDGRTKAAKHAFERSLLKPTDNTVAQAHWARRHIRSLSLSASNMGINRGFEARAHGAYDEKNWLAAKMETSRWQLDEPFSCHPASFGSYLGVTILGDYEFALQCAEIGLMAEPRDATLLNNKAVALAYMNETKQAFETFRLIPTEDTENHPQYVHIATAGLLNFRAGYVEEGREHYQRASDLTQGKAKSRVLLHWAGEELRVQSADAPKLRELAIDLLKRTQDPAAEQLERVLLSPQLGSAQMRDDQMPVSLSTLYIPSKSS
ncbi:MAG: hypothetical protein AAFR75_00335 [Pseudomonadota bacterium]